MEERGEWLEIHYRIRFVTPFHLGTGVTSGLIDSTTARERTASRIDDGLLYVPASTLKGTIRDHCEQIALLAGFPGRDPYEASTAYTPMPNHPIDRLFGSARRPGTLWFADGRLVEEQQQLLADALARAMPPLGWQSFYRTRVALSHIRRTALTGRLFSVELGLPGMEFEASVRGRVQGQPIPGAEELATCPTLLLVAGMLMVDRLGGQKSSGSGRCELNITSLRINDKEIAPETLLQHLEVLSVVAGERGMTA